jgi:hypothetical protein
MTCQYLILGQWRLLPDNWRQPCNRHPYFTLYEYIILDAWKHVFSKSALDGGKWSASRPSRFTDVEVTLQLTVSQSVSMSRYRAHSGTCDQISLSVRKLSQSCCIVSVRRPLWREVGSVICPSQSNNSPEFTSSIYVTCVLQFSNLYTIYTKFHSVPSEYSRLCSTSY